MTQIVRYEYDENGQETINGYPATVVTATWNGEIDADGVHIDDAYNIENVQITGNDSSEQLSLVSQIVNIKTQKRYTDGFQTIGHENIVEVSTVIQGVNVIAGGSFSNPAFITYNGVGCIQTNITNQDIINNINILSNLAGVTLDTTPIPYSEYGFFVDNNQAVNIEQFRNKLFYIDSNGDVQQFGPVRGLYNVKLFISKYDLRKGYLGIGSGHIGISSQYQQLSRVLFPGGIYVKTDTKLTSDDIVVVDAQLYTTTDSYPRIFTSADGQSSSGMAIIYENGMIRASVYGTGWNNKSVSNSTRTERHVYKIDHNVAYFDNEVLASSNASGTASDYFIIFGMNNMPKGYVYEAYIIRDGQYFMYLVPAKRLSDGKVGLYDAIRDIFFLPNSGSLSEA